MLSIVEEKVVAKNIIDYIEGRTGLKLTIAV